MTPNRPADLNRNQAAPASTRFSGYSRWAKSTRSASAHDGTGSVVPGGSPKPAARGEARAHWNEDNVVATNAVAKKLNITLHSAQGFIDYYVGSLRPFVTENSGGEKNMLISRRLLEDEALKQGITRFQANKLIRWYEAREAREESQEANDSPGAFDAWDMSQKADTSEPDTAAPAPKESTLSPEEAKRRIKELTADSSGAYWRGDHPQHKKTVAHVERLYKDAYPE
jgi:hypothetical protein